MQALYLKETPHQVRISVIGCGGTGTQLLQFLARANVALLAQGHEGIHVVAYDDDVVSEANIGRQLFQQHEIGMNKASAIIGNINRFHGFTWDAMPYKYSIDDLTDNAVCNILITCVDNWQTRVDIDARLKELHLFSDNWQDQYKPYFWIDCGNGNDFGQVIVGSVRYKLPSVVDLFPDTVDEPSQPSCSLAEALLSQDLIINPAVALIACKVVYKVCLTGELDKFQYFVNTDKMEMA